MSHTIKLERVKLIEKVKENKEAHIADYHEAVEAYAKEAEKQLKAQLKELKKGSIKIHLNLVTPVDRTEEFNDILAMLEWDTRDELELNQHEFKEYVLDESHSAKQAFFLNSTYKG